MKIKSCYIAGFGKIKSEKIEFKDGFNLFERENGFGKTTLATFIKAMFYGLESYKSNYSKDKKMPERLKFYPLSGGGFGGNIEFTEGGNLYRIERTFGKKSDTEDVTKVYKNNEEFFGFEPEKSIGEALFGLNENAFIRTLFIGSEYLESSGAGISENSLRAAVADKAIDEISANIKTYKASANAKNPGKIPAMKKEADELSVKIKNYEKIGENLGEKYKRLSAVSEEIKILKERKEKYNSLKLLSEVNAQYAALNEKAEVSEEKLAEFNKNYPYSFPKSDEIESMKAIAREIKSAEFSMSDGFTEEEKSRLKLLDGKFAGGTFSDEQAEEMQAELGELKSDLRELSAVNANLDELKEDVKNSPFYLVGEPTATGEEVLLKLKKYTDLLGGNEQVNADKNKRKTPKICIALLISAIVLVLGGAGVFFINKLACLILFVVGIAVLFIDAFIYLLKRSDVKDYGSVSANRSELTDARNEIYSLIARYGYVSGDPIKDAYDFNEGYLSYKKSRSKIAEGTQKTERLFEKTNTLSNDFESFLSEYGFTFDNIVYSEGNKLSYYKLKTEKYESALKDILTSSDEYKAFTKRAKKYEETKKKLEADIDFNLSDFKKILVKYDPEETYWSDLGDTAAAKGSLNSSYISDKIYGIITDITSNIAEKKRFEEDYGIRLKELSDYKTAHPGCENAENVSAANPSDIAADDKKLDELLKEEVSLNKEIEEDEKYSELTDGLKAELSEMKETIRGLTHEYEILKYAEKFMKEAKDAVIAKYTAPIESAYKKYVGALDKNISDSVKFSDRLEPNFEKEGKLASEGYLSDGEKAVSSLGFRLAAAEAVFGGNLPFVIMDDPFVFLDKKHLGEVKVLLEKLSETSQIIYFCCHESRNLI
ncbi:MAG: AAA family ATPase [Clostridia bacterium]|nr:AAA family ATPase [Clostridia bacterium]